MEVENTDKTILRRLEIIQAFADRQRPALVVIRFIDGSSTTTDPGGAIDILRGRGARGEVDSFQTDNPVYSGWARLLTDILHPAPNREVRDFE